MERPKVIYAEIPSDHSYSEVWDLQKHLQSKVIRSRRAGDLQVPGYLLLCEHQPVITIGKSGNAAHLKISDSDLQKENIEFFKINRGGDITFHGPGQITGYPILDLDQYYHDLHRYVRDLEEVIIQTIATFGIEGKRVAGYTGVWIVDKLGRRKIAAIGIHMSRWVSMHGFALNVSTELNHFDNIIPCGIRDGDTSVTSVCKELESEVSINEVKILLKLKFSEIFGFTYVDADSSFK